MIRVLRFAQSAITIDAQGARAQELVNFLYHRVTDVGDAASHARFVVKDEPGGILSVMRDDAFVGMFQERGAAAEALLGANIYDLVNLSAGGAVFHAAAVAFDGRAMMIAGASGAGKTTLTAHLLARGAAYLTDELLFVPHEQSVAHAFTRPLNLKLGSRGVVTPLIKETDQARVWSWSGGDLIDASAFNDVATQTNASMRLLLMPTFEANASLRIEPLTAGQCTQALLGTTANARSLPRHGLGEAARLAREMPGYRLTYGSNAQVDEIEGFLRAQLQQGGSRA